MRPKGQEDRFLIYTQIPEAKSAEISNLLILNRLYFQKKISLYITKEKKL